MHTRNTQEVNVAGRQRLANVLRGVGSALIGGGALICILLLAVMAAINIDLEGVIYVLGPSTFIAGVILAKISLRFNEEEKRLNEHFARLDRNTC